MDTTLAANLWRNLVLANSVLNVSRHIPVDESWIVKARDACHDIQYIIDWYYLQNGSKPICITLDTGDVQIIDNVQDKAVFNFSKIYNYTDILGTLFPELKPNRSLTFYLTSDCNLRCKYCYEACKDPVYLELDDIEVFLNNLFAGTYNDYMNLNYVGSMCIQFIGGEPMLAPHLIQHCIDTYLDLCKKYCRDDLAIFTTYEVTTNGVNYFTDSVQKLIACYPELSITVSLDGNEYVHNSNRVFESGAGSYVYALKATKAELQRQQTYVPKYTLSKFSLDTIFESLVSLYDIGIRSVTVTPALEEEYNAEEVVTFYKSLCKYVDWLIDNQLSDFTNLLISKPRYKTDCQFCGGQGSMLTLAPGGKLYSCQRFMSNNCKVTADNISFGYVDAPDFSNKALLRKAGSVGHALCNNCPIYGYCNHCPAIDYSLTGKVSEVKSMNGCGIFLAQAMASNYYLRKLGKQPIDLTSCTQLNKYFNEEVCEI